MAKKVVKKLEKKQSGGSEDKYAYKKSVYPDGPTFKPTSPTQDSTKYYQGKFDYYLEAAKNLKAAGKDPKSADREKRKAIADKGRQSSKGKPGFDANGFPMKKMGGTLAKKAFGDGNTNAAANTSVPVKPIVPKVKQQVVASGNEQYRKANELDSSGKMKYMRKTGSGPKTILEGDYAAGNYKKGGATSKFAKLAPPYNKVTFADKIAGAKKKSKK